MIILPILTTRLTHFFLKGLENVTFWSRSERVKIVVVANLRTCGAGPAEKQLRFIVRFDVKSVIVVGRRHEEAPQPGTEWRHLAKRRLARGARVGCHLRVIVTWRTAQFGHCLQRRRSCSCPDFPQNPSSSCRREHRVVKYDVIILQLFTSSLKTTSYNVHRSCKSVCKTSSR